MDVNNLNLPRSNFYIFKIISISNDQKRLCLCTYIILIFCIFLIIKIQATSNLIKNILLRIISFWKICIKLKNKSLFSNKTKFIIQQLMFKSQRAIDISYFRSDLVEWMRLRIQRRFYKTSQNNFEL